MNPETLARIERWNWALAGLAVSFAAVALPSSVTVGLAVGAGIGCVNFSIIRKLVSRWFAAAADDHGGKQITAFLFVPKMAALITAVFFAIRYVPMNPVAFAVGFSIFLVSIAIESIRFALTGAPVS